jgi:cytochrome c-type biogenesis protein CcmH
MNNALWLVAGFIAGIVVAVLIVPLWRGMNGTRRRTLARYGLPVAGALLFVGLAALFTHLQASAPAAKAASGSAGTPDGSTMAASHADAIEQFQSKVAKNPRDAQSWLALANLYRQQRQFAPARDAFAKLVELNAMTADSWADYADVQASLSKSLSGAPAEAIDRALALDPNHTKALWLKASLEHEQGHDAEALKWWTRLRALLPADSSDARLIDNNIAEARRLTGLPAPPAGATPAPAPHPASPIAVAGTVALDPRFAARVAPGTPVFIYAKAPDAPGPPVAVMRTVTGNWPLHFRLDDSMAMMPGRKLSDFDTITVEARISASGDATAKSGDLYAASAPLHPRDGKTLALTISMEKP